VIVTVTVDVPVLDGVPEMTPVAESIESPRGSPLADHVSGGVPPVAATVAL
jgi:hypothetical protein